MDSCSSKSLLSMHLRELSDMNVADLEACISAAWAHDSTFVTRHRFFFRPVLALGGRSSGLHHCLVEQ
eukprot:12544-Heterococcus_DN1.PRE.2